MRRVAALLLCCMAAMAGAHGGPVIDGEIVARQSAAIMPPAVDGLWQLHITELVPDGRAVKQGDMVVAFDGNQVQKSLLEKQSALKEKQSERERLLLDMAERERSERLATEQQRATLEKAQRKATQPAELVRRVDYQKLVIERELAEAQMVLATRREALAAEQRRQELRLVDSEIQQLQNDVRQLAVSLEALRVVAPRDGVMLHKSNWQGEKFDVGSQVWRGQAVAEIPDLATLAVRAQLPERDFTRLQPGATARISLEGGAGRSLRATVESIGLAVRSKSRVQPIQVLDVTLALSGDTAGLKPGQTVRVELAPSR